LDPRKGTKGRPEEASSWLAGAKWHEEVDVNKHDRAGWRRRRSGE